jgi:hypothetical protein
MKDKLTPTQILTLSTGIILLFTSTIGILNLYYTEKYNHSQEYSLIYLNMLDLAAIFFLGIINIILFVIIEKNKKKNPKYKTIK